MAYTTSKNTVSLLLGFLLVTAPAFGADNVEPGLIGEYFQMDASLEDFPALGTGRKPEDQRVDKNINFGSTLEAFPGTKLVDNFYVRWTGVLKVPKNGNYKFYLNSDDGSRLLIDGKQIVDNG